MPSQVGVAIHGCGGVSRAHFAAYSDNPHTRIVAAVDVTEELAKRAAEEWGADRWYTTTQEALADPDIHAADLCLPHDLHAPVAIAALEAGQHVFVEKPIANTVAEADAMIDAARRADRLLVVNQTKRYQNRHRRVKELLDAGYIGTPVLVKAAYPQDIITAWELMDERRRRTYWKHDGVVSGIGIHSIDLMRWFIGEIVEVQAIASNSRLIDPARTTEDSGIVLLTFENGCIGEITVSYVARGPRTASRWDLMPLQIFGTAGHIAMDEDDRVSVFSDQLEKPAVGSGTVHHVWGAPAVGARGLPSEGMAGAIDHFVDCVLDRSRTPLTEGADARRSLAVVEAAYRSISERRAVPVVG